MWGWYSGGKSAWDPLKITTSSQYKGKASAIDSGYWYQNADSNSVKDVLDFLDKQGSVYFLRGQWKNLGGSEAFKTFKQKGGSRYNVRLFLAQKKQITATGGEDTVTTKLGTDGNPDKYIDSQRNHSKLYVSKNSIASCSGHPYNGGVQDWGGINEVMLVENCPNACKPVRSNWELEFKYGEKLKNAYTFPWAIEKYSGPPSWQNDNSSDPPSTDISQTNWEANSTSGGLILVVG